MTASSTPARVAPRPQPSLAQLAAAARRRRWAGLAVALGVLAAVCLLSIAIGSNDLSPGGVLHGLRHDDGSEASVIVRTLRIPRTCIAVAVGAALGLAGALMQALTRNPLADPGLLGVNAGAAAAVVAAIGLLGVRSPAGYVWFALAGAGIASCLVYLLGSGGRGGASTIRMVLAGAALSAVLTSFVVSMVLLDQRTFDDYRFWSVGSVDNRGLDVLWRTGPLMLAGAAIGLVLARALNAFALGSDAGRALGVNLGRTFVGGVAAITLLCGAATAAAGPIGFVGLAVPHAARAIAGPDQRWVLPYSMVLAPILVLSADIIGRVAARPGEVQVGIITALIGAPVLIALGRRRRLVAL